MANATQLIHAIPVDPLTGAVSVPIYQTSTFVQDSPEKNKGYDYSRSGNPTRAALEKLIAVLENGTVGAAFGSGLAAIDSVIKLLSVGDEILAIDDIYGGTFRILTKVFAKFGITTKFVDTSDVKNIEENISEKTKMVWVESPTNPTLKISDIAAIAKITKAHGILLTVDNTFASPALQRPLDLGADIVVHSATKYLGGHCDVVAGLAVTKDPELGEQIKFYQNACGGVLGPQDSWLIIRGAETLFLRIHQHCKSAQAIAEFLNTHPKVAHVNYPGLPEHPHHDIAAKQQNGGFGGIISFSLKGDHKEDAYKLVTSTNVFLLAESLGGIKSLICHPATMTHKTIPEEKRHATGVCDSLIRISIGLEETEDLINDLDKALSKI